VDVDDVIEAQRLAVLNGNLQYGHIDAGIANRTVRMTEMAQVGHSGFLHERQVATVVDDRHRVGLGKPDPQPMREVVVSWVDGGIGPDAHRCTIRGRSTCVVPARYSLLMTPAILALEQAAIPFSLHQYERGDGLHDFGFEAASKLGLDPDSVFKTLIVTADGIQAVAMIPVSCQLALKAIGGVLGAKRAELCDQAVAERLTGYVIGGISPIGQRKALGAVVDETAITLDTMYVSGGKRGLDIGIDPADLIALLGAEVADIAVRPSH
jgi:Cys-tRNA(Pro)/Cys-tRNA(Cys) deacylase